jgi:hypothetical protein
VKDDLEVPLPEDPLGEFWPVRTGRKRNVELIMSHYKQNSVKICNFE